MLTTGNSSRVWTKGPPTPTGNEARKVVGGFLSLPYNEQALVRSKRYKVPNLVTALELHQSSTKHLLTAAGGPTHSFRHCVEQRVSNMWRPLPL